MLDRTKPQAFVLNMYATGLGIARDLGCYGIPVVGISSRVDAPGNISRFCRTLIGPDSMGDPDGLLQFLLELGKEQNQKGILFPTRDADILFIEHFRKTLQPLFVLPPLQGEQLHHIMDKERLAKRAAEKGFSVPFTCRLESMAALDQLKGKLQFPMIIKPIRANDWRIPEVWSHVGKRKGVKVQTFGELRQVYKALAQFTPEILIQEWVPGEEDEFYILGAYCDADSQCLGAFTARKIAQYPKEFGLGCLVIASPNEAVRKIGIELLAALEFCGIAEVEFKLDGRSGDYRLIEVNPRHWDQHTLGSACGINLSYLMYRNLCSDPQGHRPNWVAIPMKSNDVCWIHGGGFLRLLLGRIRQGDFKILRQLRTILFSRKVFSLWNWRDVRPFLRAVIGCKTFLRKKTIQRESTLE